MSTVALGNESTLYDVYADDGEADNYLLAKFGSSAWFALTGDEKKQALVSSTRIFDRQCWLGDKTTSSGQDLAWPRTGTGIDGVEDDIIPQDIVEGSIELAFAIVSGSTVESNSTPGAQGLQTIKAGSVLLTYFRDAESFLSKNSRFPLPVQELVGKYLCGQTAAVLGVATGASAAADGGQDSVTGDDFGFDEGL